MKRPHLLSLCVLSLALALAAGNSTCAQDAATPKTTLRIVTFNIQIGRGPGGDYSNPAEAHLDRTAAALKALNPDIAGLQEVDVKSTRAGMDVDQLAEIAHPLGLIPTFSMKVAQHGGEYGIGTLSKTPPLKTSKVLMKGSAHTRVLQICEFENFVFFNTHLPLTEPLRIEAAKTIEQEALKYTKPIILLGDLNALPDSPEITMLKKHWTQISANSPTYPSPAPTDQIDYIFIRNAPNARVLETRVIEDKTTSDHRPVLSVVEF